MLTISGIDSTDFLENYWQKKPLVIRNALPDFINPVSGDELAGLAMEEELESRLVFEIPGGSPGWSLKRGPFEERDFKNLPKTHWTLLVQGVDRLVPDVAAALDYFNFLPQWRIDDIMISYAVCQGSVGPHYDNYDVFLYQAQGRRKWLLTTQNCVESNYESDVELRIMKTFATEQEFILEEGDMLYLPPHVAHHGIALSDDCMTWSFGYRSYQHQELWDSFGEYLAASSLTPMLYHDPSWASVSHTSQIPKQAYMQAKACMQALLDNDNLLKRWFGSFATSLDQHAESLLPVCSSDESDYPDLLTFKAELFSSGGLMRHAVCRFAWMELEQEPFLALYINGCPWDITGVSHSLVKHIADNRQIALKELQPFQEKSADMMLLHELWKLEWLEFIS